MSKFSKGDTVKCLSNSTNDNPPSFTVGKLYTINKDGGVISDNGYNYPPIYCKTGADWLEQHGYKFEIVYPEKIVITRDADKTIARLYDGNKITKSAEAKCSPSYIYDFATGANLAYDRLMRPEAFLGVTAPTAEFKFKPGDVVEVIREGQQYSTYSDWMKAHAPQHLAEWSEKSGTRNGDIATVVLSAPHGTDNDMLNLCRSNSGKLFIISDNGLKHTAPAEDEKVKPEIKGWSGKAVCVESKSGTFTKGKVYEFENGAVTCNTGYLFGKTSILYPFENLEQFNEWSGYARFIEFKGEA